MKWEKKAKNNYSAKSAKFRQIYIVIHQFSKDCTGAEEEEEEEMCAIPYAEREWCHLTEYDTYTKQFRLGKPQKFFF